MSDSLQQTFVLDGVVRILCVLELGDRLKSIHCPVCELPGLRPPDVHVLGADHNYDDLEVVIAD